jgi:hypothetical protein
MEDERVYSGEGKGDTHMEDERFYAGVGEE